MSYYYFMICDWPGLHISNADLEAAPTEALAPLESTEPNFSLLILPETPPVSTSSLTPAPRVRDVVRHCTEENTGYEEREELPTDTEEVKELYSSKTKVDANSTKDGDTELEEPDNAMPDRKKRRLLTRVPSRSIYTMTAEELRKECKFWRLPVGGRKDILIRRLEGNCSGQKVLPFKITIPQREAILLPQTPSKRLRNQSTRKQDEDDDDYDDDDDRKLGPSQKEMKFDNDDDDDEGQNALKARDTLQDSNHHRTPATAPPFTASHALQEDNVTSPVKSAHITIAGEFSFPHKRGAIAGETSFPQMGTKTTKQQKQQTKQQKPKMVNHHHHKTTNQTTKIKNGESPSKWRPSSPKDHHNFQARTPSKGSPKTPLESPQIGDHVVKLEYSLAPHNGPGET